MRCGACFKSNIFPIPIFCTNFVNTFKGKIGNINGEMLTLKKLERGKSHFSVLFIQIQA